MLLLCKVLSKEYSRMQKSNTLPQVASGIVFPHVLRIQGIRIWKRFSCHLTRCRKKNNLIRNFWEGKWGKMRWLCRKHTGLCKKFKQLTKLIIKPFPCTQQQWKKSTSKSYPQFKLLNRTNFLNITTINFDICLIFF